MTSKEFVARRGINVKLTSRPNIAIYKLVAVECFFFNFSNSLVICQRRGLQVQILFPNKSFFAGVYYLLECVSSNRYVMKCINIDAGRKSKRRREVEKSE